MSRSAAFQLSQVHLLTRGGRCMQGVQNRMTIRLYNVHLTRLRRSTGSSPAGWTEESGQRGALWSSESETGRGEKQLR